MATADTLLASGLLPQGYSNPVVLEQHFQGGAHRGAEAVREWLEARDEPLADAGVRALVDALDAPAPPVRMAAAWALERLGAGAEAALSRLLESLRADPEPGVRAAVARSLGALEPAGAAAVPSLFGALGDPHEAVRHAAAQALSGVALSDEDIPRLEQALQNGDVYVSASAAWRLGNLGERAGATVPALVRVLERPGTHVVAFAALARIGPAAEAAVPALISELSSPDGGRRWRAAKGLGRIGPGAHAGVPDLIAALEDPWDRVGAHAARALGRIGDTSPATAAALQGATGAASGWVRAEARKALERLHRAGVEGGRPQVESDRGDPR